MRVEADKDANRADACGANEPVGRLGSGAQAAAPYDAPLGPAVHSSEPDKSEHTGSRAPAPLVAAHFYRMNSFSAKRL